MHPSNMSISLRIDNADQMNIIVFVYVMDMGSIDGAYI